LVPTPVTLASSIQHDCCHFVLKKNCGLLPASYKQKRRKPPGLYHFETAGELDNVRQMHRHKSQSCVTGEQNKFSRFLRRTPTRVPTARLGKNTVCRFQKKAVSGTRMPLKAMVLVFSLMFVPGFAGFAQDASPSEYQIKAAFLYNFAKFVQWPPQAFAGPGSPMVIGVLGDNVFGDNLERTIRNKTIDNHPFEFREFHSVKEATNCQILFISPSEKKRLPKILNGLRGTSVLTVSETDHFIEAGGMINFDIEDSEVHFQINNAAAKKSGLIISSKLLSLATHGH
jgi:YfiR/HmsC-like